MHPLASALWVLAALAPQQQDGPASESLFDGKSLRGWRGEPGIWRVEDGCIVGSTVDKSVASNTFLVWEGGDVADFEFACEVRLEGDNNSGVQYRSKRFGEYGVAGYQADVHPAPEYLAMLYEERGAGIVCKHGRFVARDADGGLRDLGAVAAPAARDLAQWHTLRIVARGNLMWHELDGTVVTVVQDDKRDAPRSGILALQVHAGKPMTVRFRNLTLKRFVQEELAKVPGAVRALQARDQRKAEAPKGATPQWLWDEQPQADEELFFRRAFSLSAVPTRALVSATADNRWRVLVNGKRVHDGQDWAQPKTHDVTKMLKQGDNVVAMYATNEGGPAAVALRLSWQIGDDRGELVTDGSWSVGDDDPDGWDRPGFDASGWKPATVLGGVGQKGLPWTASLGEGALGAEVDPFAPQFAVPAVQFGGALGAGAMQLLEVPRSLGSWVALCADDRGRLYASDQARGLYRITPASDFGEPTQIERVDVELDGCQGLCWFRGSLYAVVNTRTPGLYRLTDTDGDDKLDTVQKLGVLDGGGEHGPHAVMPAPDGENLLVMCGNHTKPPELAASKVPMDWAEDRLLPKMEDPNGHAVGIRPPGGYVCKVDPEGKRWELICCGFRNSYDLAALPDGRLVTYDADMEWDMGMPWYRPTRLLEVRDGADYGWRSGSNKWFTDYPDTPEAVCEVGPGSPTGVVAHGDRLLALDWTFGTIYAIGVGSTTPEIVITGAPFPVADAVSLGGKLYVVTGGRGLPSNLYAFPAALPSAPVAEADEPRVVPREIAEVIAAVRAGGASAEAAFATLAAVDWNGLDRSGRIAWLRGHALALLRGTEASADAKRELGTMLLAKFPTGDDRVDGDLAELLAVLEVPGFVQKAIPLLSPMRPAQPPAWTEVITRNANYGGAIASMLASMPPTGQIAMANALRATTTGWTTADRAALLEFFVAARTRKGGASYDGYLKAMARHFWAQCPPEQQVGLTELAQQAMAELPKFASTPPKGPGRKWTLDEAASAAGDGAGADLAAGRNLFHATGCAGCHYFAGEGGVHGPDLSSLANKFSARDVLEAILDPNKVVSDQYSGTVVTKKDGSAVFGRASKRKVDGKEVWEVIPATAEAEPVRIPVAEVASVAPSPMSPMPAGLIDGLSPTELRDLIAYLRSRGGK
ncbi:MAG: hypothetical protein RL398_1924 [Planctomycetota bacterium]